MDPVFSTQELASIIVSTRKQQDLTQPQLAAMSGVGVRFIVDLERGKPTCQIGKILQVLHGLGLKIIINHGD